MSLICFIRKFNNYNNTETKKDTKQKKILISIKQQIHKEYFDLNNEYSTNN
jgi:predicted methyltransferase